MNENITNYIKPQFYDFLSLPHNPEDIYTLLYIIEKNDNYEIYKAINNETRDIVSIKIIPLDNKISYQKLKQETLILKSLKKCENIIHYYGSYFSFKSKNIWLIYEYCPPGSVYDLLKAIERPLIEQEIAILINDILCGLVYMNQLNIVHNNIKITNILLGEKAMAKLGNFSQANQKLNNFYNKKEKNIEGLNDVKYDIFLLGIVCLELFKGINNFDRNKFMDLIKKNNNNNIKNIIENNYFVENEQICSKDFIDFVQKCLTINSHKRPVAFELKNHPFIKNNINSTNSERLYFTNLIKFNIEKIEYQKKEKDYTSNNKDDENENEKEDENNRKENVQDNEQEKEEKKKETINFSHLYSSIDSDIKKNNKSSINISAITNHRNNDENNNTNMADKIAEFRIEQMKKNEEIEFDKYTNNDIIVDNSNLDNTGFHYGTDDSFEKSLKKSAVFGKGELLKRTINNNKTFINEKNTIIYKNILSGEQNDDNNKNKKEENIKTIDNSINNISDKKDNLIKKESNEIDYFKANWDHLNKYENIIKNKNSENNINLDFNTHFLHLNSDESFDISNININFHNNINSDVNNNNTNNNSNISIYNNLNDNDNNKNNNNNNISNNNVFTKYIPFSDMKCNVIQLGTSIKKNATNIRPNWTSDYSLGNNTFRVNENNESFLNNCINRINDNMLNNNRDNINNHKRLLLSFGNNNITDFTDLDINIRKSYTKEKINKHDISSTCFTSLKTPNNKVKGFMEKISEKEYSSYQPNFTLRPKNSDEIDVNVKKSSKKISKKKFKKSLIKSSSEYKDFKIMQKPSLYKYIKEFDNKKETKIKKKKTNAIKVEKLFNKRNDNYNTLENNPNNVIIKDL